MPRTVVDQASSTISPAASQLPSGQTAAKPSGK